MDMNMIEGIGDEVVYVIAVTAVMLIVLLAWYSTFVEHPVFRASVLVIERRRTRSSQQNLPPRIINVISTSNTEAPIYTTSFTHNNSNSTNNTPSESDPTERSSVINEEAQPANETVSTNDTTEIKPNEIKSNNAESENNDTELRNRFNPSMNSVGSSSENETFISTEEAIDSSSPDRNIRVRLVFLNDTQRLVEAKLDDRLGQFKQQHFSEELANHRVVRLIYNGQLLQSDQETLQFYGLSDNCVVHCHISTLTTNINPARQNPQLSSQTELDLSRLMLPLFGLILGLVWCCRLQYRQYFNAASTFALIGITGLFVASVFSVCLTARDRIRLQRQQSSRS